MRRRAAYRPVRWALLGLVGLGLSAGDGWAGGFGKLTGSVTDLRGKGVADAQVQVSGPCPTSPRGFCKAFLDSVRKVVADREGKFNLEAVPPGWYLIVVTTPPHVPALRVVSNLIRVSASETTFAKFTLANLLQIPTLGSGNETLTTQGEDWRWVLRSRGATRAAIHVLPRVRNGIGGSEDGNVKGRLPNRYFLGFIPRKESGQPLAENRGMTGVLAYSHALSPSAELLMAGSMVQAGDRSGGAALSTTFRGGLPAQAGVREVSVTVHRLNLIGGLASAQNEVGMGSAAARGIRFSYSESREILPGLLVSAGVETDYLEAAHTARAVRPQVEVLYDRGTQSRIAFRYTSQTTPEKDPLLNQVGRLNAFPRVTLRNFRPELESLHHVEMGYERVLNGDSKLALAAYIDRIDNAAVLSFGDPRLMGFAGGNLLPNPTGQGNMINAGDVKTSGFRAAYERGNRERWKTVVAYTYGGALTPVGGNRTGLEAGEGIEPQSLFRVAKLHSLTGKFLLRIPVAESRIMTSYQWMSRGVVSRVDPFGQAQLNVEPFLGLTIRQPLPMVSFLPGRIEAVADFRNLLAQGYIPIAQSGDEILFLAPSYRSFRGGFSLLF